MLRLVVDEKDRVVQSASIPVRWCVSKEVLDILKEKKVVNPYILICTVVDKKEMTRQLVPMEDMMTYVQFASPGENTIFARIEWGGDGKYLTLWKNYLQRSEGKYNTDVIDWKGEMTDYTHFTRGHFKPASVKVVVPKELFAKEPPEWEKWWVNVCFSNPPKDQCDYRKRRLIAYTVQPIWFLLLFAIRAFVTTFVLFCGKAPSLKPLFHLTSTDTGDIWEDGTNSIFIRKWWRNDKEQPFLFLLPLAPICWVILFSIFWLIASDSKKPFDLTIVFGAAVVVCISLAIIGGLVDLFSFLIYYCIKKIKKVSEKISDDLLDRNRRKIETIFAEKFEPLLCDGFGLKSDITDLPPNRQTIHLRFLDLKAKVCKPFAKH